MTTLGNIEGNNPYCWPGVISALTGITTDEAAKQIQILRGSNRNVRGVFSHEGFKVLAKYNITARAVDIGVYRNRSLFMILSMLKSALGDGVFLVVTRSHIMMIEIAGKEVWFLDNNAKKPLNAAASIMINSPVLFLYKVIR